MSFFLNYSYNLIFHGTESDTSYESHMCFFDSLSSPGRKFILENSTVVPSVL